MVGQSFAKLLAEVESAFPEDQRANIWNWSLIDVAARTCNVAES